MTEIIVVILVLSVVIIVIKNLMADDSLSRHSAREKRLDKAHSRQKPNKVASNSPGKTKTKKTNVVSDTATVLAGAAIAHKMMHHKNGETRDIADDYRDPFDTDMDDLYDLDIEDDSYDNSDYDRYIAACEEEQAAYDDFIASLDMDD